MEIKWIHDTNLEEKVEAGFNQGFSQGFNQGFGQGFGTETTQVNRMKPEDTVGIHGETGAFVFMASRDIVIQSIWKGFMGAANSGLNSLTSRLNNIFNQNQTPVEQPDYATPFKPTLIKSALRLQIDNKHYIQLHGISENYQNGIMLLDSQTLFNGDAVEIGLYNFLPTDKQIKAGEIIAIGTVHKIRDTDDSNKINLDKDE